MQKVVLKMENQKYKALFHYLQYIESQYNLQISIHDFTGILAHDNQFSSILHPFLLHKNKFCMYIKSKKELFNKCLCKREDIAKKCMKVKDTFYGMCFAGVEEFVVPVFHNQTLIMVIFAGIFRQHQNLGLYIIKKITEQYDLNYETLLQYYYSSLSPTVLDVKTVRSLLSVIAQYLEYIYKDLYSHSKIMNNAKTNTTADYILIHALEFIDRNYHRPLSVSQIAKHFHCSESYIHHIFKSKMKATVKNYINRLRIECSKKYLCESNMSIKNIALNVGFNDPNYFSKVFCEMCRVTPTQYRKLNSVQT